MRGAIIHYPNTYSWLGAQLKISVGNALPLPNGLGGKTGVYRVLFGRTKGKRPLGRPRRRWDDNIKIDLRETGIDGENWIQLTQDRVQWRACVNMVMNLRVP
jgi:hypothetical protein